MVLGRRWVSAGKWFRGGRWVWERSVKGDRFEEGDGLGDRTGFD